MLHLEASSFLDVVFTLDGIRVLVEVRKNTAIETNTILPAVVMDDTGRFRIKRMVDGLIKILPDLNAKATLAEAERLSQKLESATIGTEEVSVATGQIFSRFKDELKGQWLLHIGPIASRDYNAGANLFGDEVIRQFPCLSYEIDEVGKCLGLERSTAAAFHLIRCLEAAIRALSRCLGIEDPTRGQDRSWAKMLRNIHISIESRWKPNTPAQMTDDARFFEAAYALLTAMQNPYRNSTMHFDEKYTLEEANNLRISIGLFMKKLACRMNEQGEPKV